MKNSLDWSDRLYWFNRLPSIEEIAETLICHFLHQVSSKHISLFLFSWGFSVSVCPIFDSGARFPIDYVNHAIGVPDINSTFLGPAWNFVTSSSSSDVTLSVTSRAQRNPTQPSRNWGKFRQIPKRKLKSESSEKQNKTKQNKKRVNKENVDGENGSRNWITNSSR